MRFLPVLFLALLACGSGNGRASLALPGALPGTADDPAANFDAALRYHWLERTDTVNTIAKRIPVPAGFRRIDAESASYTSWLRHLPLLPEGSPVLLYNGRQKVNQSAQAAVLDIDVGKRDLQQCADAVMRLRAEYLYFKNDWENLHFNYTSGHRIDFKRWSAGERPVVSGNNVSWKTQGKKGTDHENFRSYLDNVFQYAGSKSLSKELQPVKNEDMRPGDVFIIGGFPGHAVTVMDMAINPETGEKLFLLAQSYMPAQQIHVLKNPGSGKLSPWYSLSFKGELETPEWTFPENSLMRFK